MPASPVSRRQHNPDIIYETEHLGSARRKGRKDLARSLPSFKVLGVLFLGEVSSAFLPSKQAGWAHQFHYLRVGQQYVMRVPLATAHEKGYAGGSPPARRRSSDSSAASLPTVGPGCSEAPPSVAPPRGSTQQRCCMKRASRAGPQPLEVPDGRDVSPLLWPRRPPKDGRGVPHHED
jgi:hypothetical protein